MSESVSEKIRRTRAEQGLPPELEDGPTLERIVDLLVAAQPKREHPRQRRRAS